MRSLVVSRPLGALIWICGDSLFLVLVRVPSSFSCRSLLPRDPLCSIDLLCYPRPLPEVGWTVGVSATESHVLSPPLFLVALVSIVCARFLWVIHLSLVGPLCVPPGSWRNRWHDGFHRESPRNNTTLLVSDTSWVL